jgi:hypothetical protein
MKAEVADSCLADGKTNIGVMIYDRHYWSVSIRYELAYAITG